MPDVRQTLLMRFFKTEKGVRGRDIFSASWSRYSAASQNSLEELTLNDVRSLLKNRYHEVRLIALMILIEQMKKADEKMKKKIFDLYLQTRNISTLGPCGPLLPRIVGSICRTKTDPSYDLARSPLCGTAASVSSLLCVHPKRRL
jgi:hypothetical protein